MKNASTLHFAALISLLRVCFDCSAYARQDVIPGSRYTSARAAALSDAYLPLGDDAASGLFYNPATLGKIRRTHIEPLNMSIYVNSGFISVADSNLFSAPSLSSYIPTLEKKPGQLSGFSGQLLPNIGFRGFSFGILGLSQLAARANGDGTITYQSLYQIIPTIGTGFRLFSGIIRIGYTLQWVNQSVGTRTAASGVAGYDLNLAQGSGFSHNVGIAVTAPIQTLPALNIVVRNLFGTEYSSASFIPLATSPSGSPPTDPMSFDASLSFQPRLGKGAVANVVIEDRDVFNSSGVSFLGHLAGGIELDFRNRVFLRGGWGGGYPSAGIGLRRPHVELSLTWYTEEIGTQYLSQGDSRFMLQYQIRNF